jgi:hypothetical protein
MTVEREPEAESASARAKVGCDSGALFNDGIENVSDKRPQPVTYQLIGHRPSPGRRVFETKRKERGWRARRSPGSGGRFRINADDWRAFVIQTQLYFRTASVGRLRLSPR